MPDRSDLENRYAAAIANTKAAETARDAAIAEDSAALLKKLIRKSAEARFEALADLKLRLTAADRRALVESIRGTAAAKPTIAAGTATRWEMWRSRLRYRLFSTAVTAFTLTTAVVMIGLAYHRTPTQWVMVQASQSFMVERTSPGGVVSLSQVNPGSRFATIGYTADQVQLREWEAGTGYATFWVQRSLLAAAPDVAASP